MGLGGARRAGVREIRPERSCRGPRGSSLVLLGRQRRARWKQPTIWGFAALRFGRFLLELEGSCVRALRCFQLLVLRYTTRGFRVAPQLGSFGARLVKVDTWGDSIHSQTLHEIDKSIDFDVAESKSKPKTKKFKDCKQKKKRLQNVKESNTEEVQRVVDKGNVDEEKVDKISLADEDCRRGMKKKFKKVREYKKQRLGNVKENITEEVQRVVDDEKVDETSLVDEDCTKGKKKKFKKVREHKKQRLGNVKENITEEVQRVDDDDEKVDETSLVDEDCTKGKKKKFKKDSEHKKQRLQNVKESNIEEVQRVDGEEKVDEITFVDEDCTRGMKKWLMQYKESRPGLEVLQQRIDEFVTAHEEQLEQEKKEREARAAEDGWTVVVHQKGRKKTTDAETGTVVGSVPSAAVIDKMSKKKTKIALDFYRFQKREAKMNEIMMLRSKFEQDKKRIQQLRSARKFRPY